MTAALVQLRQAKPQRLPTASAVERAKACLASCVLPQTRTANPYSELGTEVHRFIRNVIVYGKEKALGLIKDDDLRDTCKHLALDDLPFALAPNQVASEVTYAWDYKTNKGREIGRDLERDYINASATEYVGTADVSALTLDRQTVCIWDVKTGRAVTRASENLQVGMLALAAARFHRVESAHVAIVYLPEDGSLPYVDSANLDVLDLDSIGSDLMTLAARIRDAEEQFIVPTPNTGPHCKYCPSFVYCPSVTKLIGAMAQSPEHIDFAVRSALTIETSREAYARWKFVGLVYKRVGEAIHAFAEQYPIPLENGMVFGPVETTRESIDGAKAHATLKDLLGDAVAEKACELSASKASIDRALREHLANHPGESLAALTRRVLGAIQSEGGVASKTSVSIKEHRKKGIP